MKSMLDTAKLEIGYVCGGRACVTSDSNGDLTIGREYRDGVLRILIDAKAPIAQVRAKLTLTGVFGIDTLFLANGFQSWTDTKEMKRGDTLPYMSFFSRNPIAAGFSGLKNVGDYNFCRYRRKPDYFHSHGFTYLRDGDTFRLFGSLTDRKGYTVFYADLNENRLTAEKDLEGVVVEGEYPLFELFEATGEYDAVFDAYFAAMELPRRQAEPIRGYTSWYNYYQNINADIVVRDLEALAKATDKINTFQIDDGYQVRVGEWLNVNEKKFPQGMKPVADAIHAKGLRAGIWLAPFGVQWNSPLLDEHPDWVLRDAKGKRVKCGMNWNGFYALDIYNEGARAYIKRFFDVVLNEWGYDLVKLDFLYAAAMIPRKNKSRGEIMYEAMDLLREAVGDKMILGCGVPMMPCFGKVEYMRIGADMGLSWGKDPIARPTHREDVSTINAINNSLYRRCLNGRAFLCDPDVFLLRDYNINFDWEQRKLLAKIIKIFGGVLFTSDDVGRYNDEQLRVMNETLSSDEMKVSGVRKNGSEVTVAYTRNGAPETLKFDLTAGKVLR